MVPAWINIHMLRRTGENFPYLEFHCLYLVSCHKEDLPGMILKRFDVCTNVLPLFLGRTWINSSQNYSEVSVNIGPTLIALDIIKALLFPILTTYNPFL